MRKFITIIVCMYAIGASSQKVWLTKYVNTIYMHQDSCCTLAGSHYRSFYPVELSNSEKISKFAQPCHLCVNHEEGLFILNTNGTQVPVDEESYNFFQEQNKVCNLATYKKTIRRTPSKPISVVHKKNKGIIEGYITYRDDAVDGYIKIVTKSNMEYIIELSDIDSITEKEIEFNPLDYFK